MPLPWILVIVLAIFLAITLWALRRYERPLQDVSRRAEARSPATIHLTPKPEHEWTDGAIVSAMTEPLLRNGFVQAGDFSIEPLQGVTLRLLVNPQQAMYSGIIEHRVSGYLQEIVCRYQDGSSLSCSRSPDRGVEHRPGVRVIRMPGADAEAMYQRLLRERKSEGLRPVDSGNVVALYEEAYALDKAWRQQRGPSPAEVVRVAERMRGGK